MSRLGCLVTTLVLGACAAAKGPDQPTDVAYSGAAFPSARGPLPTTDLLFVANTVSDTISAFNPADMSPAGLWPVGRDPVIIDGPSALVLDEPRRSLYVLLTYPDVFRIASHDEDARLLLHGYLRRFSLDDFSLTGEVRLDAAPGDVVLTEDGKRLIASAYDWDAEAVHVDPRRWTKRLHLIDPEKIDLQATDAPGFPLCLSPLGLAASKPDGSRVFAACYGEDAIAIVDLSTPQPTVTKVRVAADAGEPLFPHYSPFAVTLSPDDTELAVSCDKKFELRLFDVAGATLSPSKTIQLDGYAGVPAYSSDGALIYVPMSSPNAIVVIDRANPDMPVRHELGDACPAAYRVLQYGARLMVLCRGNTDGLGRVVLLDATTLESRTDNRRRSLSIQLRRAEGPTMSVAGALTLAFLMIAGCGGTDSNHPTRTAAERGEALFQSLELGAAANGYACNDCHDKGDGTDAPLIQPGAAMAGVTHRPSFGAAKRPSSSRRSTTVSPVSCSGASLSEAPSRRQSICTRSSIHCPGPAMPFPLR